MGQYQNLEQIATRRRIDVLNMIYTAKTGHIGGSMSSLDMLTALYYEVMDVDAIKAWSDNRDPLYPQQGAQRGRLLFHPGGPGLFSEG